MAFSEMGTFHLCFILNWNKLINILELCFTTNLSKQNAAFLMCSGNRLSQISLSSKDSGVKEMFYHYMLLNLKVLSGFVSSPLLVFSPGAFSDTTPLVLSKHRTSSGSPLPRFLTSSLIYCFLISVLWNFLNLAFYTLCVLVFQSYSQFPTTLLPFPQWIFPFISRFVLIILCFAEAHSPPFPALHPLHFQVA